MLSLSDHTKHYLLAIITLLAAVTSPFASAQHADIWLVLNGNQTAVSPNNLETLAPV